MAIPIPMPQLGESVTEATVTKWLKSPGDAVQEYEAILEVNTDKVDSEIPSPGTGVLLAALVSEGEVVKVGALLAWIGQPGEEIPGGLPAAASPAAATTPIPAPAQPAPEPPPTLTPHAAGRDSRLGFISPVVARLAAEHSLDLSQLSGSGLGGRITKKDVLAFIERGAPTPAPAPLPGAPAAARPAPSPMIAGEDTVLPLSTVRRAIAEHMVMSKHTSPHVTTVMEADLSRVISHRNTNKEAFARDGANLTFTAYFVAAAAEALRLYPLVNSSWSEAGVVIHRQINIGMATSLGEEGLIVPVIKNASGLSLLGLARTINDLANRARAHKLQPDEVKGGTFTITNHGISGSLFASPIINQPQCGILGVGAVQKRAVVISDPSLGDVIAIRPMAYLTLTFDHRILDGAIADYFLAKVVEFLKNYA
ncbi:MAG: 2-oxo acid dehydrogenase subunit E2 [Anaerolineales bacterium]|nr:2-oxo acid dehydrogenase subunit E2 [Anaerolineales bacterium]